MRRTRVWVSAFSDSFIHKIFVWILAVIRVFGEKTGRPVPARGPYFSVWGFWLGWTTGLPVLAHLHSLDEELDDKPGTTIGTKFSVLHWMRIPFLMRCGFWPLIHSYEYPWFCWRILKDFNGQEHVKFLDIDCCFFMRLNFTIGCHNPDGDSGNFYCFQFCWIQVFPVYHVHRRVEVHHKFSFLAG